MRSLAWAVAGVVVGAGFATVATLYVVSPSGEPAPAEEDQAQEHVLPPQVPVPRVTERRPTVPRVIYLDREGAVLVPGVDNSEKNVSSIVNSSGLEQARVPGFRGTVRVWDQIVECVAAKFAPYQVEVVDQRPVDPGYIMAVIGGTSEAVQGEGPPLGRISGLAPFNGQVIEDSVVLVFSDTLRNDAKSVCEVTAMEVAQAYGLDHARHCSDLMSFIRPCGDRTFTDRELPCGENEDRACSDGELTQNAHQELLAVLGPRGAEPPVEPKD